MNNYLFVFIGGGIGCITRFWISNHTYTLLGHGFPYGTLLVNISGSFLMGLLFTIILEHFNSMVPQIRALLLVGFLGGYTTFSSFSIETLTLFEQGEMFKAILNILSSFICCMIAVWAGVILGRQL